MSERIHDSSMLFSDIDPVSERHSARVQNAFQFVVRQRNAVEFRSCFTLPRSSSRTQHARYRPLEAHSETFRCWLDIERGRSEARCGSDLMWRRSSPHRLSPTFGFAERLCENVPTVESMRERGEALVKGLGITKDSRSWISDAAME